MGRIPYVGIVVITVRGSNITRIILPRSRADNVRKAVVIYPRRTFRRCTLIILMPAIGHPLIDIAAHIIEAEGVRLETADLQRSRGVVGFIASFTIGHIRLKLIAPPKLSFSAATRSVLPFGFAREPEGLLRGLGEPIHKLLRVSPA